MTEPGPLAVEESSAADPDPYVIGGWDSRASRPGLPARSLRAARAVATGLFATENGAPDAARLDWLERDLGDFFGHTSLRSRLLFRACIATLFWLAPLLSGHMATMASLRVEERVAALHAFERTPLSLALLGAKAILCILWFEHPEGAREIGWDQGCKLP